MPATLGSIFWEGPDGTHALHNVVVEDVLNYVGGRPSATRRPYDPNPFSVHSTRALDEQERLRRIRERRYPASCESKSRVWLWVALGIGVVAAIIAMAWLDSLDGGIAAVDNKLATVHATVGEAHVKLDDLKVGLAAAAAKADDAAGENARRFDSLDTAVAASTAKATEAADAAKALAVRLDVLSRTVGRIEDKVDSHSGKLDGVTSRLDAVAATAAAAGTSASEAAAAARALETKIDALVVKTAEEAREVKSTLAKVADEVRAATPVVPNIVCPTPPPRWKGTHYLPVDASPQASFYNPGQRGGAVSFSFCILSRRLFCFVGFFGITFSSGRSTHRGGALSRDAARASGVANMSTRVPRPT